MYFGFEQWHFPSVLEKTAPDEDHLQKQRLFKLAAMVLGSEQVEQVPWPLRYLLEAQAHVPVVELNELYPVLHVQVSPSHLFIDGSVVLWQTPFR